MKLRRCAPGLILALWIPWTSAAAELSPRKLKKQADKSWDAGEVKKAAELYERVLAATPAGTKARPEALYALSLLSLTPDSAGRSNPERAKVALQELANSFPTHKRRREILALLESLDSHDDASAQATGKLEEAKRQQDQELRVQRAAMLEERLAAETRITSLEAELEEARQQLTRKNRQRTNQCQEIEKELKKAKEDIRKLAQECAGCSDGP